MIMCKFFKHLLEIHFTNMKLNCKTILFYNATTNKEGKTINSQNYVKSQFDIEYSHLKISSLQKVAFDK